MGVTPTRRLCRRTRGMAMVEMVFVLPLLLLIVFAIAEFGLMFNRWVTLSNAVREGARVGVVFRLPCNPGPVETAVKNAVITYANGAGVPIAAGDVNVVGECAGSGTNLTVDATYDFELRIPFSQLASVPLAYSSTMRNE